MEAIYRLAQKKLFCTEKLTEILVKIVRSGSVKIRSINSGWEFDIISVTDPMRYLEIFLAETKIQNFQKYQINFFRDRILTRYGLQCAGARVHRFPVR